MIGLAEFVGCGIAAHHLVGDPLALERGRGADERGTERQLAASEIVRGFGGFHTGQFTPKTRARASMRPHSAKPCRATVHNHLAIGRSGICPSRAPVAILPKTLGGGNA